jgi:DNA polymerase III delta prime subunit
MLSIFPGTAKVDLCLNLSNNKFCDHLKQFQSKFYLFSNSIQDFTARRREKDKKLIEKKPFLF